VYFDRQNNVALQLTKLWLMKVTTPGAAKALDLRQWVNGWWNFRLSLSLTLPISSCQRWANPSEMHVSRNLFPKRLVSSDIAPYQCGTVSWRYRFKIRNTFCIISRNGFRLHEIRLLFRIIVVLYLIKVYRWDVTYRSSYNSLVTADFAQSLLLQFVLFFIQNKKLCCRRRTARRAMSVEILSTEDTSCTTNAEQNRSNGVGGLQLTDLW